MLLSVVSVLAGLAAAPTAAQDDPATPQELWDAYPLDPNASGTPEADPAATAAAAPPGMEPPSSSDDEGTSLTVPALVAASMLAFALGLTAGQASRRRRGGEPVPEYEAPQAPTSLLRAPPASPATLVQAANATAPQPGPPRPLVEPPPPPPPPRRRAAEPPSPPPRRVVEPPPRRAVEPRPRDDEEVVAPRSEEVVAPEPDDSHVTAPDEHVVAPDDPHVTAPDDPEIAAPDGSEGAEEGFELPWRRFARDEPWLEAEHLWSCEIVWKPGYRKASFRAMAAPPGEKKRRAIAESPPLRWTLMMDPDPEIPEMVAAVEDLVSQLEAAGWEREDGAEPWFAQRFLWRSEGEPRPIGQRSGGVSA